MGRRCYSDRSRNWQEGGNDKTKGEQPAGYVRQQRSPQQRQRQGQAEGRRQGRMATDAEGPVARVRGLGEGGVGMLLAAAGLALRRSQWRRSATVYLCAQQHVGDTRRRWVGEVVGPSLGGANCSHLTLTTLAARRRHGFPPGSDGPAYLPLVDGSCSRGANARGNAVPGALRCRKQQ